jgi:sulfate/thiosulfate transport system substrate-binding protein
MRTRFFKLSTARVAVIGAVVALALGLAACGSSDSTATGDTAGSTSSGSGPNAGTSLNVVGYSTPQSVYEDALEPGFQKTTDGAGVDFSDSFGPSGDQSRAVESGQPADVVHFSIQPDMQRLVDDGIVDKSWDQNPYDGFVQDSVVTFVVRKGNPKDIHTWADLVKPGVQVVTPNPFQSGSAKWNLMAGYGAELQEGKSPSEAEAYLKDLLSHAQVQPASASDATAAFNSGQGDVLLSYENEAIASQKAGNDVDYVIPDDTILIQTPIAVTKDAPPAAAAFVKYLYTPQAQQDFADAGYRPVVKSVFDKNKSKFPTPKGLFTINDVDPGGWDTLNDKFFDPDKGIVAGIEQSLGVSTSG